MKLAVLEPYLPRLEAVFDRVGRRMEREFASLLPEGITLAQAFAARLLAHREQMTVSEIAAVMGVTASAVTSLTDRLIESGYVERERDGADRRVVRLRLTGRGHALVADLHRRKLAVLVRYLGRLPEADVAALVDIYERLAAIMEA